MCGIIVYYGDAENRISRLLNGMWAIVYRAPDSTGIGLIGNDLETMKIRRELGSFEPLMDRLIDSPIFDEGELRVISVLDDNYQNYPNFIRDNQKKLLRYEGLAKDSGAFNKPQIDHFPRWSEFYDTKKILEVEPGTCGNPEIQEYFSIDSEASLKAVINRLLMEYDLPMGVVEKLIGRGLEQRLEMQKVSRQEPMNRDRLRDELKALIYRCMQNKPLQMTKSQEIEALREPDVRQSLWEYLKDTVVVLPADFTTDGIANLFRSIDSSVLSLAIPYPEIDDKIQAIFENFWSINKTSPPVRWRSLYRTEKIYNVYGIAAAAALTYFQTEIYLKQVLADYSEKSLPPGHLPGRTHPRLLKSMIQPVIGHGRWAIQSPISVKNSHPFLDEKKYRSVVLNGMFSSKIESQVAEYLTKVAGITLRSENSSELLVLLWGHYFETFSNASYRYRVIKNQIDLGLEKYAVGSLSIDYGIFNALGGKSTRELDEMAFIHACEVMLEDGGQFAVTGISLLSPNCLFVATHRRPVYIVRRPDISDYMVVSDVNAAIGLFPQNQIQSAGSKLQKLMDEFSKKSLIVETAYFDDQSESREAWYKREKMALLSPFKVDIYALDQERLFASITTKVSAERVYRELEVKKFSGKTRKDILPEQTYLSPVIYNKEFGKTFYEEHLQEIPTLLEDALTRHTGKGGRGTSFDIKSRLLQRRFGANLASLNRIILVGTGTSLLVGEIVEKNLERFLVGVNIIEARTHEFDNVDIDLNPDSDLVVVVSWSGTTSEIVDFASRLLNKQILMVGITEKPFSDLGLIARKSVGVIPVCSGEEVTLVATKSAICTLFTMYLFCFFLSGMQRHGEKKVAKSLKEMADLPENIRQLLHDDEVIKFCQEVAAENQRGALHYLLGALHSTGTERVAAVNLEINSWNSMGVALDWSELAGNGALCSEEEDLVVVNATSIKRLKESVMMMSSLAAENVRFYCVTYNNRERAEIDKYAEKTLILPKVSDHIQPFIDLPFMFLFGLYYGLARGRIANELPRNLAKSVTAGRARCKREKEMSDWYESLEKQNNFYLPQSVQAKQIPEPLWVEQSAFSQEKIYYQSLIHLFSLFNTKDCFTEFFLEPVSASALKITERIYGRLAEDGGALIFVPMDKKAEGGCRSFIRLWSRFFSIPMQLEFPEKLQGVNDQDSILFVLASKPPPVEKLSFFNNFDPRYVFWMGPADESGACPVLEKSADRFIWKQDDVFCGHEKMYLGLSLLFSRIIKHRAPKLSGLLEEHFHLFRPSIVRILSDEELKFDLRRIMNENLSYRKRLFLTGLRGSCSFIRQLFHLHGGRQLEGETFGMSAYSHLVLVDPEVSNKYVAMNKRQEMTKLYSENQVEEWERRYLGGNSVDQFLQDESSREESDKVTPFFYEDTWYLPVIRPDYDTNEDCFVIIDATSENHFDEALDELATFGSRHARVVVITQRAFAHDSRLTTLKKHPLSEIVYIPGLPGIDGNDIALSDYILPVIFNIIATSMYYSN